MAKLIAGTYSEALFELALEQNVLDAFEEEAAFVKSAIEENNDLEKMLNHPKISREEKISVIENIFKGRVSDDITGFLIIIVSKGRTSELKEILDEFLLKVKEYKKIGTAHVTSAFELSAAQKAKLEDKLLATTDYEKFEMDYKVDPSLIGGMTVRIKDRVVDNSVKTKLHHLSQKLSKIQLSES